MIMAKYSMLVRVLIIDTKTRGQVEEIDIL